MHRKSVKINCNETVNTEKLTGGLLHHAKVINTEWLDPIRSLSVLAAWVALLYPVRLSENLTVPGPLSWFLFTYIPQHLNLDPLLPHLRFPLIHSWWILWLQPKSSKSTWLFKHTKDKTNKIHASPAFFLPAAWHSPVFCLKSWVFAVADRMTDRVHMPLSFSTARAPECYALLSMPQNSPNVKMELKKRKGEVDTDAGVLSMLHQGATFKVKMPRI